MFFFIFLFFWCHYARVQVYDIVVSGGEMRRVVGWVEG